MCWYLQIVLPVLLQRLQAWQHVVSSCALCATSAPSSCQEHMRVCWLCPPPTVLQKLAFSVCEVKLVPLESITAVERSIADFNKTQQDQVRQQHLPCGCLQQQGAAKSLIQRSCKACCVLLQQAFLAGRSWPPHGLNWSLLSLFYAHVHCCCSTSWRCCSLTSCILAITCCCRCLLLRQPAGPCRNSCSSQPGCSRRPLQSMTTR